PAQALESLAAAGLGYAKSSRMPRSSRSSSSRPQRARSRAAISREVVAVPSSVPVRSWEKACRPASSRQPAARIAVRVVRAAERRMSFLRLVRGFLVLLLERQVVREVLDL